jgi:hypothetical protein
MVYRTINDLCRVVRTEFALMESHNTVDGQMYDSISLLLSLCYNYSELRGSIICRRFGYTDEDAIDNNFPALRRPEP